MTFRVVEILTSGRGKPRTVTIQCMPPIHDFTIQKIGVIQTPCGDPSMGIAQESFKPNVTGDNHVFDGKKRGHRRMLDLDSFRVTS